MSIKIALIANTAMSVAIILGAASAASAAAPNGSATDLQQCVAGLQASGRSFGVDPEMGVTEYDVMVGRCTGRLYRQQGSQRRQSR